MRVYSHHGGKSFGSEELAPDERVIDRWNALVSHLESYVVVSFSAGALIITNQRLIFAKRLGAFSKEYALTESISLMNIRNVRMNPRKGNQAVVEFMESVYGKSRTRRIGVSSLMGTSTSIWKKIPGTTADEFSSILFQAIEESMRERLSPKPAVESGPQQPVRDVISHARATGIPAKRHVFTILVFAVALILMIAGLGYLFSRMGGQNSGGGSFVGSVNSDVYHYPNCYYAQQIQSGNEIWFSSSSDARSHGYHPCSVCNPP